MDDELLHRAAESILSADALLIGAGAGMGVDSGLPDFRGNQGFWQAYPPYARLGLGFTAMATAQWFRDDPAFAWGFYGHRLNLYRATGPHAGFCVLKEWAERVSGRAFVYTSNVGGQFQRAGFDPDRLLEVHGSIHWLQCVRPCGVGLFPADTVSVEVDPDTMRARPPLPACPQCGGLARPNILMFGDPEWDYSRAYEQEVRLNRWLADVAGRRVTVVECGAGTAIPTVRRLCEQVARTHNGALVRINMRESDVPPGHVGLACGALDGLHKIDRLVATGVGT